MLKARARSPGLRVLYILVPLALIAFVGLVFYQQVERAPSREQIVGSGNDKLRVQLWMSLDPPKIGTISLEARVANAFGTPVQVDRVVIAYGQEGKEAAATTEAIRQADGAYRASAGFTAVGDWWVDVTVVYGPLRTTSRFPVRVVPSI
ncbi:MAG: hypothetical protein HY684_00635 [Chloroflexi bacterium]|nr:hypothetical protein [Chloroflexota bacterium]